MVHLGYVVNDCGHRHSWSGVLWGLEQTSGEIAGESHIAGGAMRGTSKRGVARARLSEKELLTCCRRSNWGDWRRGPLDLLAGRHPGEAFLCL